LPVSSSDQIKRMIKRSFKTGTLDRKMSNNLRGKLVFCSKGHQNGPTARFCWGCGEFLQNSPLNKKDIAVKPVPYESPLAAESSVTQHGTVDSVDSRPGKVGSVNLTGGKSPC